MAHWLREDYGFTKGDWYRPYSSLNGMPVPPSPAILKEIQINAIKKHNSQLSMEINHLNSFLNEFQNFARTEMGFDSEADFFSIFSKKINTGYGFFDMSDKKNITLKDTSWLDSYINSINDFTNILSQYSGKEIPKHILNNIKRIEANIQKGNFYGFRERKSQLWEDIATWILQMAGFEAIGSGTIIDMAGKQLIQDTIAWLPSQLQDKSIMPKNSLGVSIRYTRTKTKSENKPLAEWAQKEADRDRIGSLTLGPRGYVNFNVNSDIQGFNNLMEEVSQHSLTKKITVKLNDSTKEYLSNFLSVQAKSGSGQDLLNNQKRDLINIATLWAWDKYLNILNKFYNNFSYDDKVSNGSSDTLAAYTNWIFSKNIAKTTLGKNVFFLSQHGFTTLDMSMTKDKFYFKLAPNPNSLKLLNSTSFSIEETKG